MCDVVFITPNMTGNVLGESLGSLQLATILQQQGISCDIIQYFRIGDANKLEDFLARCVEMVGQRQPKILSLYTRCDVYHIQLRIAQRIKETWPEIYVVCGGPQSDITAEETIRRIPWVDFVCCGEGENTIYPLFSSLLRGEPDLSVDGLVYRQNGDVVKNPRPQLIQDLDQLPMLDFSLFHFSDDAQDDTPFPVDVGRGCPFGCTFCSTKSFWGRKFRLKSPQRIIAEIKLLHDQFGITRFNFSHDMFTFDRKKVAEVCKLMKTLDFSLEWGCSARLDCIDKEMIDVMADAGMKGIYLGIETGSPRMQKLIKKNLKLETAVEIVAYLKKRGIETTASFIYGFPEETEEDLSQTMALIGKLLALRSVKVQTHLCAFLVGTELSVRYWDQMTPVDYYSDQTGDVAVDTCKDLIQDHPQLFQHMFEYKTELRSKLGYFPAFFHVWRFMQPVYQYLAQKYPENRLIDMYYDFVEANQEILQNLDQAPENGKGYWLSVSDKLPEKFAQDEKYDIIRDMYKYRLMQASDVVTSGGDATEVFCFDVGQIGKVPLESLTRCLAMVNWSGKKCNIQIFPV